MSATSRLKQLLFIAAALALVSLGLVAALSPASPARADDTQTCESSPEVNEGPTGFLTAPPDGRNWQIAETRTRPGTGTSATSERINYTWTGGPSATHPVDSLFWQLNQGEHDGAPHDQPDGVPYQVGGGNSPWFLWKTVTTPGIPAVIEHTYTLHIDAVTCPPVDEECVPEDYNGEAEGCGTPPEECVPEDYNGQEPGCGEPPVDEGKKIVVCKYTGTPPGGLSHIIVVSENTLNNVEDANGNPFAGVFPFEWTDAQGQAGGSVAIGYDDGSVPSLSDCPDGETPPEECVPEDYNGEAEGCGTPPEECVPEDYNGQEPGCGEPPVECPDGDHNGQEPGCGEPDPGPDCDEDPTQEHCENDDEDCEEDPNQEECENDNPDCVEDPTQKKCDEDKPPVVVPDDGNSPNNGPTVRGASATAPTAAAGTTTVAGTPGARVPTAVNAGLAPQELGSEGGPLGLLGIATALLGAALVGLTVRPRRRTGAASHART